VQTCTILIVYLDYITKERCFLPFPGDRTKADHGYVVDQGPDFVRPVIADFPDNGTFFSSPLTAPSVKLRTRIF